MTHEKQINSVCASLAGGTGPEERATYDAYGYPDMRLFADFNSDRIVEWADFGIHSASWQLSEDDPSYNWIVEYNGDGFIDWADYGAFSAQWQYTVPLDEFSRSGNSYGFTARRTDRIGEYELEEETSPGSGTYTWNLTGEAFFLQYNRARYYRPDHGRWIARDPAGYVDGMNLYEYVRSNPLGGTDSLGLFKIHVDVMPVMGIEPFVSIERTANKGCCKNGTYFPKGKKKLDVGGGVKFAFDIGSRITINDKYTFGVDYDLFSATIAVYGECETSCNGPFDCCKACGSLGLAVDNALNAGIGLVNLNAHTVAKGDIRACYNFGNCPQTGWAVAFCGNTEVKAEASVCNPFGRCYSAGVEHSISGCRMLLGTEDMLDDL